MKPDKQTFLSLFMFLVASALLLNPASFAEARNRQAPSEPPPPSASSTWNSPLRGTDNPRPYKFFWKIRIMDFVNSYEFKPDSTSCEGDQEESCLSLLMAIQHGEFDVVPPLSFSPNDPKFVEASPLYEVYSLCPQNGTLTPWQRDFGTAGINQLTRNFAIYDMTHSVEERTLDNTFLMAFKAEGFKQIDPQTKTLMSTGYTDNGIFTFLTSPGCQMAVDIIGVNQETPEYPASSAMIAEIVSVNGQPYVINGFIHVGDPEQNEEEEVHLRLTTVSTNRKTTISFLAFHPIENSTSQNKPQ